MRSCGVVRWSRWRFWSGVVSGWRRPGVTRRRCARRWQPWRRTSPGSPTPASQRAKGSRTAPNRSLVYSDTRRSATARIGGTVLDAMAPLDPLMTSAAWLMAQLGARVERRAVEVYEKLSAASGEERVNLADFWFASMPILHGGAVTDAQEVLAEFQRRWARIIPLAGGGDAGAGDPHGRRVPGGRGVPPGPGGLDRRPLPSGPDVLIAARDTESIGRGDFELVLANCNLASNTMGASLFVSQHPEPAELLRLTGRDHPRPPPAAPAAQGAQGTALDPGAQRAGPAGGLLRRADGAHRRPAPGPYRAQRGRPRPSGATADRSSSCLTERSSPVNRCVRPRADHPGHGHVPTVPRCGSCAAGDGGQAGRES